MNVSIGDKQETLYKDQSTLEMVAYRDMWGKGTDSDPVEIRRSSEDRDIYLYYTPYEKYHLCVVARHLNGDGFIITAYITDKIKEGETVWKR